MATDQQRLGMESAYGARIAAQASTTRSQNDIDSIPENSLQSNPPAHRHHSYRKPVALTQHVEKPNPRHRRTNNPIAILRTVSRRTLIIIAVIAVAILILIIGLAAGLSHRGPENLPLPSDHGGPYTGDLTYYATGLGACGITSSDGDSIVAVSHLLFDAVQSGTDPNSNPLCGMKLRVQRDGRSVDLKVVDRCTGCAARDLDVTEDTFSELADVALGRVQMRWSWLEDVAR